MACAAQGPFPAPIKKGGGRRNQPGKRLHEVTVLVASMEAINTHKVVLQHLSPWQPHLPSSADSEGAAQGGGCQCVCVWLCVHVCPCGCCERSHQRTGEEGPQAGTQCGTGALSAAALAPSPPFSLPRFCPFWLAPFSLSLFLAPSPSPSLLLSFSPSPCPSLLLSIPITFSPAVCLPLLLLAWSPPAGSPLPSPSFSLSTAPRSVQVLKRLHVDKIIKYLTENLLSSFPEPLPSPRTSQRDGPPPGRQEWSSSRPKPGSPKLETTFVNSMTLPSLLRN